MTTSKVASQPIVDVSCAYKFQLFLRLFQRASFYIVTTWNKKPRRLHSAGWAVTAKQSRSGFARAVYLVRIRDFH